MASFVAKLSPTPLFICGRRPLLTTLQTVNTSASRDEVLDSIQKLQFTLQLQEWQSINLRGNFVLLSPKPEHKLKDLKLTVVVKERRGQSSIVTKATGDASESSTSLSVVKSVQNVWDKSEDRVALIGLGFAAVVALWASANLITAIDKLPLIPSVLEFVGILFSTWVVYRYLLFKPDREELSCAIQKSIADILGQ